MNTNIIKVGVVEDHIITRQGIIRLLSDDPRLKVVGEAGDGEEAVKMVTEKQPDVVLMDIALPKLNGIEATKQIKKSHPEIAVLVLSAYDDDEYVFGLLEAGAAGYLLKTSGGEELVHAIVAVRSGESVLDPIVTRKIISRFKGQKTARITPHVAEQASEREVEIMKLAAIGLSNKIIADRLNISRRTVESNLRMVFNKLGVGSRTEAVIRAIEKGWFTLEDISES